MERKAYSTDLTDAQWQRLQSCLSKARNGRTGRRRKYRRLVKDYEFLPESSEAMIRLAMCHLLVRRLKTT